MSECPYKQKCNGKDCLSDFCLRRFKLDYLFDNALIPDSQRKFFSLVIDADGTDFKEFTKLAEIEKTADEFVAQGKNLYIHSTTCGNGKSRPPSARNSKIAPKTSGNAAARAPSSARAPRPACRPSPP